MTLSLSRPLVFLDVETTSAEVERARIVQLGAVKLLPTGERRRWVTLVNPEVPIPPASTDIHGITDDMVRDAPTMRVLAPRIFAALEGCDVGGFNVRRFDLPVLELEAKRGGVDLRLRERLVVDAFRIYQVHHPRDLSAAVANYLGREMQDAHDALADAEAALDVMLAQASVHGLADVMTLHAVSAGDSIDLEGKLRWVSGEATVSFGKHKGRTLRWVAENDESWVRWVLGSNFGDDMKSICRAALDGRFPAQKPEAA